MAVGANIKKRRYELKMSQQELAEAMGYKTRSTIAKIESGENDVSQKKLQRFAAILDTTVEALISGASLDSEPVISSEEMTGSGRRNAVIILAGGKSGRNKQNIPNQFISIHEKPMIVYCMEVYQAHPAIDDIYIVCLKGWEDIVRAYARQYRISKLRGLIPGSSSGIASLKNGVDCIKKRYTPDDIIIIHDGIRPLVDATVLSDVIIKCRKYGNAVTSLPYNEQIFVAENEMFQ